MNLRKCSEADLMKRMNLDQKNAEIIRKALFSGLCAINDIVDLMKENAILKEKLWNLKVQLLARKVAVVAEDPPRDDLEFLDDLIKICSI